MARKEKTNTADDIMVATEEDLATHEVVLETNGDNKKRKGKPSPHIPRPEWFKLDNAANIYPALGTKDLNAVFRISVVLDNDIQPDKLQQAAEDLKSRFPTFYVQVRKGFFWYYLEPADVPKVEKESRYPCRPFAVSVGNKPLFRIIYFNNRISIEVFHSVTDGNGALTYLYTLIHRYLTLCGISLNGHEGILDYRDDPLDAELEDSFHRYYKPVKNVNRVESRAWQLKGHYGIDKEYYRVIKGTFSVEALKKITKPKNVSITQYLTALLIFSLAQTRRAPSKKAIRVCVPLNLRKFFPSATLRNFSLFANVGLPCTNETSLDEILASIVPQMNDSFKKDALHETFSMNVKPEYNPALRIVPLYIKALVLGIIAKQLGDTRVSTTLSNIGAIDLPPSLKPFIKEIYCVLGRSYINGANATCASIGDRMSVVFASPFPAAEPQSYFFHHLEKNGVHVEVESNV